MRIFSCAFGKCWLLPALLSLALVGCNKDDTQPKEQIFGPGILIANEGPFQNGSGTLTHWDRQTGEVVQDAYGLANEGDKLGNIVQSLALHGDQLLIAVNNAGKVVVADANTLKFKGEITGLAMPRYITPLPGSDKAFVSQWGSSGLEGSVALVNTSTYAIEATIPTGAGAEAMLLVGNELWVTNSGGFGRDSTVVIIDVNSLQVVGTIVVGDNPNSIVRDQNGDIWVLCGGYAHNFDPNDPLSTKGRLVRLSNKVVTKTLELPNDAGRLIATPQGNRLFYLSNRYGGQVYEFYTSQPQLNNSPFLDGAWYSLGYDPVENTLLVGSAADFASAGVVRVLDGSGNLVREIPAGIIPTFFLAY